MVKTHPADLLCPEPSFLSCEDRKLGYELLLTLTLSLVATFGKKRALIGFLWSQLFR